MHMSRLLIGLLLSLMACFAVAVGAGKVRESEQRNELKDEVVVCRNDAMPDWVWQANMSFTAIYRLKTGVSGQVDSVTRLHLLDTLPDKGLVDCLRQWRFPVAQKEVTVVLNWKHMAGWTSISINIPGFPPRIIRTSSWEAGDLPSLP